MSSLQTTPMPTDSSLPVGIFDSGVGGLSVLSHIHAALPHEHLLYCADSGYAPYGDKTEAQIIERSLAMTAFLMSQGIKALVIACNTATAVAATAIREAYPALPIVGIEPGLKPAAAYSKSHIVGVMATQGTLSSAKYIALQQRITAETDVLFVSQACVGLANQIEKGELASAETAQLVTRYVTPLVTQGADFLVLGCTHYPFVIPLIEQTIASLTDKDVYIIDTGEPVARQLVRILTSNNLLNTDQATGSVAAFTTASTSTLETAFKRLLKQSVHVNKIAG
jgi:glutamate racemase